MTELLAVGAMTDANRIITLLIGAVSLLGLLAIAVHVVRRR